MLPSSRCSFAIAAIFISLATLLVTGCAHGPYSGTLPAGVRVSRLTGVDPATPFAWNPAGTKLVLVSGSLQLYDPATGSSQTLGEKPLAVAWSPDGERLATASPQGTGTALRILDGHGAVLSEASIAGRVTKLAWRSPAELLAAAITIDKFAFGANIKGRLLSWDGVAAPVATTLNDITVRPFIAKWPLETLYHTLSFTLSPLGDEIVYTRLIDPPAFAPYLRIVIRHLESGAEKEVTGVAVGSAGAVYAADGERILYGDGDAASHWFDPWGERELATIPAPGRNIAVSPANHYAFIDGRLYSDGKELARFSPGCIGAFSPRGESLLLGCDNDLYLVSGLHEQSAGHGTPKDRDRLLTLRKWRSEGLISIPDYESAKERMLRQ